MIPSPKSKHNGELVLEKCNYWLYWISGNTMVVISLIKDKYEYYNINICYKWNVRSKVNYELYANLYQSMANFDGYDYLQMSHFIEKFWNNALHN